MWLPPIAPTHWGTFRQFSKTSAISFNFLESGNLMCTCRRTFITALQKSCTQLNTVLTPTPKSWLTLLYSLPVASFQRAMAIRFLTGTHKRKLVFLRSSTCLRRQQMYSKDSRETRKFWTELFWSEFRYNGIPPLVLSRIGPHCRCPSSHDHQGYLLRKWRCTDII